MNDANQNTEHVILPVIGPDTAKDPAKSDKAIKYVGRGSQQSSTEK
jgi:hypothetical protein